MARECDYLRGNLGYDSLALGFVTVLHKLGNQVLSIRISHKLNKVIKHLVEH